MNQVAEVNTETLTRYWPDIIRGEHGFIIEFKIEEIKEGIYTHNNQYFKETYKRTYASPIAYPSNQIFETKEQAKTYIAQQIYIDTQELRRLTNNVMKLWEKSIND